MKYMKKILVLGMVMIMALGALAGCGQQELAPVPPEQESQAQVQSQEQIPAESQPAEQGAQSQQGIIYEDGTPEQIFDNPQKPNTIAFIKRIRSLHYKISGRNYDLYELQARMQEFCNKYFLPAKVVRNIELLTEEVIQISPIDDGAELILEYSESTDQLTMQLQVPYKGLVLESEEGPDMLSMAIINNICSEVKEERLSDDTLGLFFTLKGMNKK